MSIEHRVRLCRMIEKMEKNKAYSEKLGLENTSVFCMDNCRKHERNEEKE